MLHHAIWFHRSMQFDDHIELLLPVVCLENKSESRPRPRQVEACKEYQANLCKSEAFLQLFQWDTAV